MMWCNIVVNFDQTVIVLQITLFVHGAQGQWLFALAADAKAFIKRFGTEITAQSLLQPSLACEVPFKASILAL